MDRFPGSTSYSPMPTGQHVNPRNAKPAKKQTSITGQTGMANFLFTSLVDCVAASSSSSVSAYLLFRLLVAVSKLRKGSGRKRRLQAGPCILIHYELRESMPSISHG